MARTNLLLLSFVAAAVSLSAPGCDDDTPQFSDETSRIEAGLGVDLDLRAEDETGVRIGTAGARHHDVACYTGDGDEFDCEVFVRTSARSAARGAYRVERPTGGDWNARRVAGNKTYFPARLMFPD